MPAPLPRFFWVFARGVGVAGGSSVAFLFLEGLEAAVAEEVVGVTTSIAL